MSYLVTRSPRGNVLCQADRCSNEAVRCAKFADYDQSKERPMRPTAMGTGYYCDYCKPTGPYAVSVIWSNERGPWAELPL